MTQDFDRFFDESCHFDPVAQSLLLLIYVLTGTTRDEN